MSSFKLFENGGGGIFEKLCPSSKVGYQLIIRGSFSKLLYQPFNYQFTHKVV